MLRFAYQAEILNGPAPPSLPAGATIRWRPLIPITIVGPTGRVRQFSRAVVDPAADDTVFPLDTAARIGARLRSDAGHRVRWRGQLHPLRFGDVELILADVSSTWRWPAVVGFSPAPLLYLILGQAGCLQFLDAHFLGVQLIAELETNPSYPGTTS